MNRWHTLISKRRLYAYLSSEAERYAAERREARQLNEVAKGDQLLGAERAIRQLRLELQ